MSNLGPTAPRDDDRLGPILERYLLHGDEEAMEEIVRRTRPRLLAVARRIGSPQDAEDALQSAYFSLLRKRGERLEAPVLPWLMTAVVRISYRQKAKNQRQHELARRLSRPARTGSPLPDLATAEEADRMRQEIAKLPAKYRDPVVLRHLHELSTAETSELLGIPEATVRTRLFRARELLKSRWPVRVASVLLFLPWLLKDLSRNAYAGASGALSTASVQLPIALLAVAAAGTLGGFLGQASLPGGNPGAAPATAEARLATLEARRREVAAEIEEQRRLQVEAERRRRRADRALAELLAAVRPLEAGPAAIAAAIRTAPPIPGAGEAAVTGTVDWHAVGEAMAEIVTLVRRIYEAVRAGEEPTPEDRGRVQELSGLLVREVSHLGMGVPAEIINHRYCDPDFMLNALASALEVLEMPLTASQVARLTEEAADYWRENDQRLTRYREETPVLVRLREESELKESFFERVLGILTPEQGEALSPDGVRGRMHTDMFGGGLIWNGRCRMMPFEQPEDLVLQVAAQVRTLLDLSESERRLAEQVVRDHVDRLPAEIRDKSAGTYLRCGWFPFPRVLSMARWTESLFVALSDRLALSPERRREAGKIEMVFMPLRVSESEEDR